MKLNYDILLSTSAFKFNLRRYTWGDSFDTIVPAHYDAPIAAGWRWLNPV
jgi:hypothetical protein